MNRAEAPARDDAPATSPPPSSRWAFLDAYIEEWFCSLMFAEAPTSTVADPRFDTFLVHLASTAADAQGQRMRRRLRYATELVAYMLKLDTAAWWYGRRRERPWFGRYDPSRYDPRSLEPKTTFAVSRVLQRTDDEPGAVRLLHEMLLRDREEDDEEYQAYEAAKRRLLDVEESDRCLRGFRIPTQLRLQPAVPENVEALRSYLQDVLTLVRAFQEKETPFRLDAVALNIYAKYLSDVHVELRALLSLGVPVTISLRHGITGGMIPDTIEWTANERANVFSIFAQDPSQPCTSGEQTEIFHTLDSKWISNSSELWSAVAYAPALRKVRVQPNEYGNERYDVQVARWMGYALAKNTSLRNLEIVRFRMGEDELDAFEAVLQNPGPAYLVGSSGRPQTPTVIRLKPDAIIACKPGGEINGYDISDDAPEKAPELLSLTQLNIPSDWMFPIVQTLEETATVEFIVPGHAICAVPLSSVASFHDPPVTEVNDPESHITSLVIHNEVYETGPTARFVRLVGRELRELRWYGEYMGSEGGLELQEDLDEIAVACPLLESLTIEETQLTSLASLVNLPLHELSLLSTPVPMAALVEFFQVLGEKTAPIAHTLQRFTYHCPQQQLTAEGIDAALAMLARNTRLYSVSLGIQDAIYDAHRDRFEAVSHVPVTIERLPLTTKLAFLSVVQHHHRHGATSALGQVDNGIVSTIFQCLGRVDERRLHLLREEV